MKIQGTDSLYNIYIYLMLFSQSIDIISISIQISLHLKVLLRPSHWLVDCSDPQQLQAIHLELTLRPSGELYNISNLRNDW